MVSSILLCFVKKALLRKMAACKVDLKSAVPIALIFLTLLGIIIYLAVNQDEGYPLDYKQYFFVISCILPRLFTVVVYDVKETEAVNLRFGCQADTFMIRDGVCDEATNLEACNFDGGDCCLDNKDITLCKQCSCKLKSKARHFCLDFE